MIIDDGDRLTNIYNNTKSECIYDIYIHCDISIESAITQYQRLVNAGIIKEKQEIR